MPAKGKAIVRRTWTTADARQLKQLAKEGLSGAAIAKRIKRSRAAVYQRASVNGVSLTGTTRRSNSRRRK